MNHYVWLNTKYKNYWLHGFRRFFNVFPHHKEANDRPSWHGQVDPKGTVGTIYAGDHKKLLYTKCINYGSHRIFFKFLSMKAVDLITRGLASLHPRGTPQAIDVATYMVSEDFFHNTCSYIDPRGVAIFDPRGLIGRI